MRPFCSKCGKTATFYVKFYHILGKMAAFAPAQRNNPGEYDHQIRTGLRYVCRGELRERTAPGES